MKNPAFPPSHLRNQTAHLKCAACSFNSLYKLTLSASPVQWRWSRPSVAWYQVAGLSDTMVRCAPWRGPSGQDNRATEQEGQQRAPRANLSAWQSHRASLASDPLHNTMRGGGGQEHGKTEGIPSMLNNTKSALFFVIEAMGQWDMHGTQNSSPGRTFTVHWSGEKTSGCQFMGHRLVMGNSLFEMKLIVLNLFLS